MTPPRWRRLGVTYRLALAAAERAGVTRLGDVSGLAGMGVPIFQAVRPNAKSLSVSQGKGGSRLAARISALLEACELACAEALPHPGDEIPLRDMPSPARAMWARGGHPLTINLDCDLPRGWLTGSDLRSGQAIPMPWDLLSLDFTRPPLEFPATSDGLATGNSREEAILAALCELLEHHFVAVFDELTAGARRLLQLDIASIPRSPLASELARVAAAGFTPRLWCLGLTSGIPVFACKLFAMEPSLDRMTPTGGSACHPDAATAALAALREAVQGRAALVAGARDDLTFEDYSAGRERARNLAIATLAFSEGPLKWSQIPSPGCKSAADGVALLERAIASLTPLPVAVFDHPQSPAGLSVVHALAPGLRNLSHRKVTSSGTGRSTERGRPDPDRAVLFSGPSTHGVPLPMEIELRPPASCGDLASLLHDPPAIVGLIDGHFGIAPTVWHKEILDLVATGVRVLGAASIGALRAAELAGAGMEGVGTIYRAYLAGSIERDDAVMVLQAPADYGFAPLTLALVDAEYALAGVACEPRDRRMMLRIARTMPYQLRSWERCLDSYANRTGKVFPVTCDELARRSILKREDAQLLVQRMVNALGEQVPAPRGNPPAMTGYYLRMLARTGADVRGAR